MSKNKTAKYLKYAIGEIILVVIGILIALSINNWNQNRKAKNNLNNIYKQIQRDLVQDTLVIDWLLTEAGKTEKRIIDILEQKITASVYDTINADNYEDCEICFSEATRYWHFEPLEKGYQLLKTNIKDSKIQVDTLSTIIDEFYSRILPPLKSDLQFVIKLTDEFMIEYQQYSWFVDWVQRKYNRDFLLFLFESETYRKNLALYWNYFYKNYLRDIRIYKERAKYILNEITKELES